MTTIKDVAERAGVAPSTVSYVLSGSRKISEDTRRTVQQAIDKLGYHPRASARTLRSAHQRAGAGLPRVAGGYRAVDGQFAIYISDAARAHGYDVLLMTAREGVPGLRRIARGGQADAAILMAVEMEDPRIAAMLELGFPTALLGRSADDAALPWTDLDWEAAAALAVHEVAAAGHRDIAYLATTEREIQARRGYAIRGVAGAAARRRRPGPTCACTSRPGTWPGSRGASAPCCTANARPPPWWCSTWRRSRTSSPPWRRRDCGCQRTWRSWRSATSPTTWAVRTCRASNCPSPRCPPR